MTTLRELNGSNAKSITSAVFCNVEITLVSRRPALLSCRAQHILVPWLSCEVKQSTYFKDSHLPTGHREDDSNSLFISVKGIWVPWNSAAQGRELVNSRATVRQLSFNVSKLRRSNKGMWLCARRFYCITLMKWRLRRWLSSFALTNWHYCALRSCDITGNRISDLWTSLSWLPGYSLDLGWVKTDPSNLYYRLVYSDLNSRVVLTSAFFPLAHSWAVRAGSGPAVSGKRSPWNSLSD